MCPSRHVPHLSFSLARSQWKGDHHTAWLLVRVGAVVNPMPDLASPTVLSDSVGLCELAFGLSDFAASLLAPLPDLPVGGRRHSLPRNLTVQRPVSFSLFFAVLEGPSHETVPDQPRGPYYSQR
eukprot:gnl/TRDRNA2_/TRDRNA2_147374_c1_seq1.p3 gnl/TRDRNA2_/TRDRNA2_147374_c1~~gnl/TRDRNA2_/TRDRNA2_147374_c1_seq1.p3  ORF type:complete len:124 (+),score=4.13 gnl/TRDRNA2_/TRDRNA2_147374_c1_seq1:250-621(+)